MTFGALTFLNLLTYIKKCFQTYQIPKVLPFIPKFRFLLILIIILLIISLGNELMSSALFFLVQIHNECGFSQHRNFS